MRRCSGQRLDHVFADFDHAFTDFDHAFTDFGGSVTAVPTAKVKGAEDRPVSAADAQYASPMGLAQP